MKPSLIIIFGASDIGRAAATRRSTFSKGICPQLQPQPQRARTCARPAFFRVFAFTSSPFGCISLKISVLRVKVSLFGKTSYLPIAQWLMGEGSSLHLNGPNGGRHHDKNDGAKCPTPRQRRGWRQHTEKRTRLPSPTTRCDPNDCGYF